MNNSPQRAAKGFTRAFWVSNTVELFERMAYYAVFIVLTIYLSSILGFNDFEASMISGLFSGGLYLLPIFSGAYADKVPLLNLMVCPIAIPGGSLCRSCLYLWWEDLLLSPSFLLLWPKKQRRQRVRVVIPSFI